MRSFDKVNNSYQKISPVKKKEIKTNNHNLIPLFKDVNKKRINSAENNHQKDTNHIEFDSVCCNKTPEKIKMIMIDILDSKSVNLIINKVIN